MDMEILGVVLIDLGILGVFFGAIFLCKPITRIGIKSRTRAVILGLGGIALMVVGGSLPFFETRVPARETRLDEFTPVYQFHELHTTIVAAPPERVYAAVKEVEPDEIFAFRALTRIRRFGRRGGAPNILNPPPHQPILQTALATGFVPLADDPGREVVVGLIMSPLRMGWKPTRDEFLRADGPLLAKATMNFRIHPIGSNRCFLTTETRIYGSDKDAMHLVAAYWRVIYPGSAFIRRMWLRAIRKRAEAGSSAFGVAYAGHAARN